MLGSCIRYSPACCFAKGRSSFYNVYSTKDGRFRLLFLTSILFVIFMGGCLDLPLSLSHDSVLNFTTVSPLFLLKFHLNFISTISARNTRGAMYLREADPECPNEICIRTMRQMYT